MRIAIDAMSGDHGAAVAVAAAFEALEHNPQVSHIIFTGHEQVLAEQIAKLSQQMPSAADNVGRVSIVHTEHLVDMASKPADILRQKTRTSMLLALIAVMDGDADGCVSAGNTGALVGLSRHFVGLLPGIKRPAICAQLPTLRGDSHLLDIGANVDCSGEQLHQFARMGAALAQSLNANSRLRVRALSIGAEAGKGNAAVKRAVELCERDTGFCFEGLIEANQLLNGNCDVIVCDGFVGNVALKACEGTAEYIRSYALDSSRVAFDAGQQANDARQNTDTAPNTDTLFNAIDPERFNGACLLGLKQPVIKSHGASSVTGFTAAIDKAVDVCAGGLLDKLGQSFS